MALVPTEPSAKNEKLVELSDAVKTFRDFKNMVQTLQSTIITGVQTLLKADDIEWTDANGKYHHYVKEAIEIPLINTNALPNPTEFCMGGDKRPFHKDFKCSVDMEMKNSPATFDVNLAAAVNVIANAMVKCLREIQEEQISKIEETSNLITKYYIVISVMYANTISFNHVLTIDAGLWTL
jgi:hypothetical protein